MYMYLLLGSLGIGIGLVYKKELSNYILSSLWHTTRYYHKTIIYLEENGYINKNNKGEKNKKQDEEYIIQYNSKIDKTKINNINNYKILDETDLIVIKIKDFYKIIEKNNNIEKQIYCLFQPIKKPFLQVDFIQDEKSTEINDNLKNFYLNGNIILDKTFIKWFMKYFYNITVSKYIINIIDENVNMFEIKGDEKIQIIESGYKII